MDLHGQGGWAVHALGWTLLHFCWQGAAVAGLLWCVLRGMGGRALAMRYGAACGAMVLMAAAPLVTFWELAAEARADGLRGVVHAPGWVMTVVPGGAEAGHWMDRVAGVLDGAAPWVPWVWMAGVAVFLVRLQVGLVVAGRMTTVGTGAVSGEMSARFEGLKERIGVRRVVRLVQTARVEAPTVIGWLRPVVLMPVGCLARLSTDQVEALLVHELAHIRRHDYLVNVVQTVVEALLFYHPGVWWVSRQVRLERECRCDALAAEVGGDALGYAKALSFLETRRAFLHEVALQPMSLGANGGVLTMRIKRLLGVRESSAASQGAALVVLAAVMVVPGGYLAGVARAERPMGAARRNLAAVEMVGSATAGEVMGRPVEALRVARVEIPADVRMGAGQEAPVRVSGGAMAGELVSRVDPVYPVEAKRQRVQGAVVLRALIAKDGTVKDLVVVSGPEALRASALDAVKQWVYKPYLLNGEPREADTTVTVNYRLEDGGSSNANVVPGGPQQVASGLMAGNLLTKVDPVYPAEAKAKGIQGAVTMRAVISKEGMVKEIELMSPRSELSDSALDAVRQWVYRPYLLNGEPMEVQTTIIVNYSLGGGVSESPLRIGGDVSSPVVVHVEDPTYSPEAREKKVSGKVLVGVWVDEKGVVSHTRVVRGVGYGLDERAVEAVKQYKFTPAMKGGRPVRVEMTVEVDFQMF